MKHTGMGTLVGYQGRNQLVQADDGRLHELTPGYNYVHDAQVGDRIWLEYRADDTLGLWYGRKTTPEEEIRLQYQLLVTIAQVVATGLAHFKAGALPHQAWMVEDLEDLAAEIRLQKTTIERNDPKIGIFQPNPDAKSQHDMLVGPCRCGAWHKDPSEVQ